MDALPHARAHRPCMPARRAGMPLRAARRRHAASRSASQAPRRRSSAKRLASTLHTAHTPNKGLLHPPPPPLALTPQSASDPNTPMDALWHIARTMPPLRKWVVVNRAADANLLEYISQQGGPGVRQALELVLESLELQRSSMQRMRTS